MHNKVNDNEILGFFAKEVKTFLQVVQNWNRAAYSRGDVENLVTISDQEWSDDKKFCYIAVQCDNMAVMFQIGQLFALELQKAKLI